MKFNFTKKNIIVVLTTVIALAIAFWAGDDSPDTTGIEDTLAYTNEQPVADTEEELDEEDDPKDSEDHDEIKDENNKAEEQDKEESEDIKDNEEEPEDIKENEEEPNNKNNAENEGKEDNIQTEPQTETNKKQIDSKAKNITNNIAENKSKITSESTKKEISKKEANSDSATSKDKYQTDPIPKGKPKPVEPEDTSVSGQKNIASLSVRADIAVKNIEKIDPAIANLLPRDGVIFSSQTVTFNEGESVFDVLQRELRNAGIHMEASFTPMYNSAYVEGINNLYEFDGGELSGWMYKVNGWFPNYGASRYMLKDGDVIEWLYTMDLGRDIGGNNSMGE